MNGINLHPPGSRRYHVIRCCQEIVRCAGTLLMDLRQIHGLSSDLSDSIVEEAFERAHVELAVARANWRRRWTTEKAE